MKYILLFVIFISCILVLLLICCGVGVLLLKMNITIICLCVVLSIWSIKTFLKQYIFLNNNFSEYQVI